MTVLLPLVLHQQPEFTEKTISSGEQRADTNDHWHWLMLVANSKSQTPPTHCKPKLLVKPQPVATSWPGGYSHTGPGNIPLEVVYTKA